MFTGRTTNTGGVAPDYLNKLAVSGTTSPVAVASGGASCYGFSYINTVSENITIPTPASSTRIDRIVLRADWATQQVRITRIAGTEGGGAPALTQSAGTTWDVPLAQASITTGGTITLTDQREWLGLLGDDAVTFAKMQNIATDRLIGRDTAASGDPEEISLGASLEFGGSGSIQRAALTGDVTAPANSNATTIANAVVTQAKLGTDTLQCAYIPIWMKGGSDIAGGQNTFSTTFIEFESRVRINKSNLPAGATAKLQVTAEWPGGGATGTVELYNVTTAAAVTGSSVATAAGSYRFEESGDFFANLASGSNTYACRLKTSNTSFGIALSSVQLCVEW